MKYVSLLVVAVLLASCVEHRYYLPSPNPVLFKSKGEVHVSGSLGISGASIRAATAVTDNLGVVVNYLGTLDSYHVHEGEVGLGYYGSNKTNAGIFVFGGLGFGNNFEFSEGSRSLKRYQGDFIRPFIQFNGGITGGTIFKGLKADLVGILRTSYLRYDGFRNQDESQQVRSRYGNIEPGFAFGFGSRSVRFQMGMSIPFRPSFTSLNDDTEARTFPFTYAATLHIILGGKE